MIKVANNIRKLFRIYDYDFVRRYADKHYYIFSRGKVLVIISDGTTDSKEIELTRHGFKENDILCNELNRADCVNVINSKIEIALNGEPKIYVQRINNKGDFIYITYLVIFLVLFYL